jgi:hypothetical protein
VPALVLLDAPLLLVEPAAEALVLLESPLLLVGSPAEALLLFVAAPPAPLDEPEVDRSIGAHATSQAPAMARRAPILTAWSAEGRRLLSRWTVVLFITIFPRRPLRGDGGLYRSTLSTCSLDGVCACAESR